ncbi:MAG: class I SAM-dependent methyltransferase [Candidatus Pacebacteria bacterium]|nr:class I SAM-dependent methyltransferase [Candidatus Paceibacterota bacterium]
MCDNCTLISLYPRPTEEEYEKFYKDEYQKHRHDINTYEQAVRIREQKGLKGKKSYIEELGEFLREGISVFDIGCGWGTFLKLLKDSKGFNVEGIEPGAMQARVARDYYGLKVARETLSDYVERNSGNRFDLVSMIHVLEHFVDPGKVLDDAKSILKSDGVLFVAVPNTPRPNEPLDRFFHFEHCYYFTPLTLNKLLKKHGLKIISLTSTKDELRVSAVFKEDSRREIDTSNLSKLYSEREVRSSLNKQVRKYRILRFLKSVARTILPWRLFQVLRGWIISILKRLSVIDI